MDSKTKKNKFKHDLINVAKIIKEVDYLKQTKDKNPTSITLPSQLQNSRVNKTKIVLQNGARSHERISEEEIGQNGDGSDFKKKGQRVFYLFGFTQFFNQFVWTQKTTEKIRIFD